MGNTTVVHKTKVLPGNKIEIPSTEFIEGDRVEVRVTRELLGIDKADFSPSIIESIARLDDLDTNNDTVLNRPDPKNFATAWDFLQSMPRVERTSAQWEVIELEMRKERDSWDD